jgi:hypothetical protein
MIVDMKQREVFKWSGNSMMNDDAWCLYSDKMLENQVSIAR